MHSDAIIHFFQNSLKLVGDYSPTPNYLNSVLQMQHYQILRDCLDKISVIFPKILWQSWQAQQQYPCPYELFLNCHTRNPLANHFLNTHELKQLIQQRTQLNCHIQNNHVYRLKVHVANQQLGQDCGIGEWFCETYHSYLIDFCATTWDEGELSKYFPPDRVLHLRIRLNKISSADLQLGKDSIDLRSQIYLGQKMHKRKPITITPWVEKLPVTLVQYV